MGSGSNMHSESTQLPATHGLPAVQSASATQQPTTAVPVQVWSAPQTSVVQALPSSQSASSVQQSRTD